MDFEQIDRRLEEVYGDSDWIVVTDVAAAATRNVANLQRWGVERIMVVSAVEGVGVLPEVDSIHYTGARGASMMGGFRAFAKSLGADTVTQAISEFDPDRTARILAPPFGAEGALVGRTQYGERPRQWMALEDKMIIDAVFDSAGLHVAPHEIVPIDQAAETASRLGGSLGTVWVADNTEGWHGGGEYVRWVRTESDARAATAWMRDRSSRVRVMPFLDGLPCSIHGFVTGAGGIAVFRPVEMLVARDFAGSAFRYLGMATTWDPPNELREQMRSSARSMARHLHATVGYRGPFSIDGIASAAGFLPTELNPRMSSGFGIQAATIEQLRVGLLTRAIVEGDIDVDASELEELIVAAADINRVVRVVVPSTEVRDSDSIRISLDGRSVQRAEGDGHGTIEIGPSSYGSVVMLEIDAEQISVGSSAALVAVAVARLASETWNLGMPELDAAGAVSLTEP